MSQPQQTHITNGTAAVVSSKHSVFEGLYTSADRVYANTPAHSTVPIPKLPSEAALPPTPAPLRDGTAFISTSGMPPFMTLPTGPPGLGSATTMTATTTATTSTSSSSEPANMAQRYLEKFGYRQGQGLGRDWQGIVNPLEPQQQLSTTGLGYDVGPVAQPRRHEVDVTKVYPYKQEVSWMPPVKTQITVFDEGLRIAPVRRRDGHPSIHHAAAARWLLRAVQSLIQRAVTHHCVRACVRGIQKSTPVDYGLFCDAELVRELFASKVHIDRSFERCASMLTASTTPHPPPSPPGQARLL